MNKITNEYIYKINNCYTIFYQYIRKYTIYTGGESFNTLATLKNCEFYFKNNNK